ncbi:MAG: peroxiredoxin [Alphaproteobacteria bacterium]|nr:peroxiredoxin [Alphaproteobacteria bacterium]
MDANTPVTLPLINAQAPEFTAPSTFGEISLSDYKGKWVVLFSHPADFTPVCTTEFIGFSKAAPQLAEMNVQLIGLSIDSVYSHIAWARSIEQNFGVKVSFPIIADLSMDVAKKFGMIHPGVSETAAVRAVFVIDPEQKIRAIIYYPMTAGRLIGEVVRLIQALQLNDATGLATPANWQPGDQCIVGPPKTQADAEARMSSDYQVTDWYFSKTDCPV